MEGAHCLPSWFCYMRPCIAMIGSCGPFVTLLILSNSEHVTRIVTFCNDSTTRTHSCLVGLVHLRSFGFLTGQPSSSTPQLSNLFGSSRGGSSGRPGGIMSTLLGGVFGGGGAASRAGGASGGASGAHRGGAGGGGGGGGTGYRILGSNTAQEILHLTNQLANGGLSGIGGATRLLLAGNADT